MAEYIMLYGHCQSRGDFCDVHHFCDSLMNNRVCERGNSCFLQQYATAGELFLAHDMQMPYTNTGSANTHTASMNNLGTNIGKYDRARDR